MKGFVAEKYQKKGALRLADLPEPEVRGDDVLVRVHATAVNLLDSKIRDGEFKLLLPYRPPFILGHDVAGTVARVGPQVRRFKEGDEVYARPRDHRIGTFAEFIAINEMDVALKPKNISMEEAASIALVGLTAWQALADVAKLKSGQKVFIQAGSGGVGTFAIQLAKHLGATIHDDEHEKCRAGQESRRRCGHRLQDARFREDFVGLRSGPAQPGHQGS
jgi:NADPH:quinone reductase-like Zn-dependent oxidoreductase